MECLKTCPESLSHIKQITDQGDICITQLMADWLQHQHQGDIRLYYNANEMFDCLTCSMNACQQHKQMTMYGPCTCSIGSSMRRQSRRQEREAFDKAER